MIEPFNSSPRVLLSNGSYKFHLAPLASELCKYGDLAGFLTAGWPSSMQILLFRILSGNNKVLIDRLIDRKEEIDHELIWSSPLTEIILKLGDLIRKKNHNLQHYIHSLGLRLYSRNASKALITLRPNLYHYRSGYGNNSVNRANDLHIPTICDHSIAHPLFSDFLVKNKGQFPSDIDAKPMSHMAKFLYKDIKRSDYLLVNSEFVKETCKLAGYPSSRIYVTYLGVDRRFLQSLPTIPLPFSQRNKGVLYVGGWQRRKGVEILIDALTSLPESLPITVAGGIEPELQSLRSTTEFFLRPNVKYLGIVPRTSLASLFSSHAIFVFPSYCEGSARVIFEAMAAGCYIITTKNSGSIVEDNIHGKVVQPGCRHSLEEAIRYACNNTDEVASIGMHNAYLIRQSYTQSQYHANIIKIYADILNRHHS